MKKTTILIIPLVFIFLNIMQSVETRVQASQVERSVYTNTTNEDNVTPSPDFIHKFNQCIHLEKDFFTIDYQSLPEHTTSEEVSTLEKLIDQENKALSSLKNSNDTKEITQSNDSIIISETKSKNFELLSDFSSSRYHEGINYIQVLWYGLRIGISKTVVNAAGTGMVFLGKYISEEIISDIIVGLGGIVGGVPGGIAFTWTPILGPWDFEWQ
ncbi:hypothetical protein [Lactococcus garvieae]|uniref:hypothetical protein n=1 Tax=Lactococcus garvieae TaxID=1363 RepID=UPI003854176B